MVSRFRTLDSLGSPNASSASGGWRERSIGGAGAAIFEVVPPPEPLVESYHSPSGTHPLVPFSLDAIDPPRPGTGKLVHPTILPAADPPVTSSLRASSGYLPEADVRHTGYLTGISLSGILQMLHMERNSCVLEVTAAGRLGTLTLVNGELIDAEVDDESGDAVALRILRWPSPATSILPSGALIRHSVNLPLTRLLMDAVRLQDESLVLTETPWIDGAPAARPIAPAPARWLHLPERLVSLGAEVALVMSAAADEPIAEAGHRDDRPSAAAAVARGVRTWSSLLVEGADRVHVIAGARRLVVASLTPDDDVFVYLEAPADMPLGAIWQAIADAS